MNTDEATLGLIKGVIFDLPPEDQQKVKACASAIRDAVSESGPFGQVALALVAAEAAAAA